MRWLAESAWFPYGFLGDAVSWQDINPHSARVTIQSAGLPVSAVFEVDRHGALIRIQTERYRDIGGGKAVPTPWTGHYGDYRDFSGFRIPRFAEVSWELPEGTFSYARFRITRIEYNVPQRF